MLKSEVEKILENFGCEYEFTENHEGKGVMVNTQKEVRAIIYYEDIEEPSKFEKELREELSHLEKRAPFFKDCEEEWEVYENIKDKLVLSVRPGYREIDREIIHRRFLDLLIIPVIIDEGLSVLPSYSMMKKWGVSEAEVFEQAKKNQKHKKFEFLDIMDVLLGDMSGMGEHDNESAFYVAYNNNYGDENFHKIGANIILEPEKLKYIKEKMGEYYIIPSSIHEIICVKKEDNRVEGLKEIVKAVNDNDAVIEKKDILSYSVYEYDSQKGLIKVG